MAELTEIHYDVLLDMLKYLCAEDIKQLRLVSKTSKIIADQADSWKKRKNIITEIKSSKKEILDVEKTLIQIKGTAKIKKSVYDQVKSVKKKVLD